MAIAAMMPIFTLERVEGLIFRPVALTYAFALVGALLFTLTAVPALTAVLLKHSRVAEEDPAFADALDFAESRAKRSALSDVASLPNPKAKGAAISVRG